VAYLFVVNLTCTPRAVEAYWAHNLLLLLLCGWVQNITNVLMAQVQYENTVFSDINEYVAKAKKH